MTPLQQEVLDAVSVSGTRPHAIAKELSGQRNEPVSVATVSVILDHLAEAGYVARNGPIFMTYRLTGKGYRRAKAEAEAYISLKERESAK
jgi:hypothetical protein